MKRSWEPLLVEGLDLTAVADFARVVVVVFVLVVDAWELAGMANEMVRLVVAITVRVANGVA